MYSTGNLYPTCSGLGLREAVIIAGSRDSNQGLRLVTVPCLILIHTSIHIDNLPVFHGEPVSHLPRLGLREAVSIAHFQDSNPGFRLVTAPCLILIPSSIDIGALHVFHGELVSHFPRIRAKGICD